MRLRLLSIGAALAVWTAASAALVVAQQPAAPAAPAPGQEQTPVFRGGVELMNLSVTVTDKRGRTVTDLTQDDFTVFEDKQPQQIVSFVRQSALELAQVTDTTGGRTHYAQGFAQMEDAIERLGKEFTQQYELAYQRGPGDGRFHEITVGVKRPDVSVLHRRTYLATPAVTGR